MSVAVTPGDPAPPARGSPGVGPAPTPAPRHDCDPEGGSESPRETAPIALIGEGS